MAAVRIGLEVHLRLATGRKLFCACPLDPVRSPADGTCPVCLGLPGALPVPDGRAVALAVRLARALGATVAPRSRFVRKHYLYPDLPRNYQITQGDAPLATGGEVWIGPPSAARRVAVRRLHLEEDAARVRRGDGRWWIDPARAGAPLVEVVTGPDLRSADDAAAFLRRLQQTARELGVSRADPERGGLRCDANLSLADDTGRPLTGRVELKNLAGLHTVARALAVETARLQAAVAAGREVPDQTRGWDETRRRTLFQRAKETAPDYLYLDDPDLPPLVAPDRLPGARLPRGWRPPHARERAMVRELGLDDETAVVLAADPRLERRLRAAVRAGADPVTTARWLRGEWTAAARERDLPPGALPLSGATLGRLLVLLGKGRLTRPAARRVFADLLDRGGGDPERLAAALELLRGGRAGDEGATAAAVRAVLAEHPDLVAACRAGKAGLLEFFVGRVLARTRGAADPRRVRELLRELLVAGAGDGGGEREP